jgi:hypothetical protein
MLSERDLDPTNTRLTESLGFEMVSGIALLDVAVEVATVSKGVGMLSAIDLDPMKARVSASVGPGMLSETVRLAP